MTDYVVFGDLTTGAGNQYFADLSTAPGLAWRPSPNVARLTIQGRAPTLLWRLRISPTTGLVTLAGRVPTMRDNRTRPSAGLLTIRGLVPTFRGRGPTAVPSVGALSIQGRAPTLLKSKIIVPQVATVDAAPNDLAPSMSPFWIVVPGVGFLTMRGLTPTERRAVAGLAIAQPLPGFLRMGGLQPSLKVPLWEQGWTAPLPGELNVAGLIPELLRRATVTPDPGVLAMAGRAPYIKPHLHWSSASGPHPASWADIA